MNAKVLSENITKVLYPNDEPVQGKELRLEQQYFFVSCSLQDMLRIMLRAGACRWSSFHEKFAVQLNDTHPAIAVAELMRLLVDEHGMDWDAAWEITRQTFAYTNHTLLPEALERWPLGAVRARAAAPPGDHLRDQRPLPRRGARCASPATTSGCARLSLIDESGERYVRMAHLACVGSHAINGVAAAAHRAAASGTCCTTSTRCGRRSSATRPTA